MPHSFGKRARTRDMFAKPFRQKGLPSLSTYLTTYKVGDMVDIKANGAVHRGMPHKYYHGRTGVVFNVTKSALGVEVLKAVKHRLIRKRINVRVEHVRPSRSREDFVKRVKENERLKKEKKEKGVEVKLKREPAQPKEGYEIELKNVVTMRPLPFEYKL